MLRPLSLIKKLSVFLLFYLSLNAAVAQVYYSSTSLGAGGTGRATVEAGDSSFLNPATLVHLQGINIFTSFAKDEFAATLSSNNKEELFPASVNFVQKKSTISLGDLKEADMGVSVAQFAYQQVSIGLTGHYLEQKVPKASYHSVNGDLGLLWTPKSEIGLALVGYNIFGQSTPVPDELKRKSSVGAGFNYIYKTTIRARVDVTSESVWALGLETYLTDFFITRIGYQRDTEQTRELLTAGLGFKGPKFGINYAYYGDTQKSSDYRHSIDLIIPF